MLGFDVQLVSYLKRLPPYFMFALTVKTTGRPARPNDLPVTLYDKHILPRNALCSRHYKLDLIFKYIACNKKGFFCMLLYFKPGKTVHQWFHAKVQRRPHTLVFSIRIGKVQNIDNQQYITFQDHKAADRKCVILCRLRYKLKNRDAKHPGGKKYPATR